jgi:hypothetical protein
MKKRERCMDRQLAVFRRGWAFKRILFSCSQSFLPSLDVVSFSSFKMRENSERGFLLSQVNDSMAHSADASNRLKWRCEAKKLLESLNGNLIRIKIGWEKARKKRTFNDKGK